MHNSSLLNNIVTYLPKKNLTNEDLARVFNVQPEQIFKTVGVNQRHISGEDELASDMGIQAAQRLLKESDISKNDIDFLIFCSTCFDYSAPSTSCIMQDKIGLSKSTACIDLPYGCSGYVYGLAMAKSFISSGIAKNILFITSDTLTKTITENNLELKSIFSDAASATLITQKNSRSIGEFVFGTDGGGSLDVFVSKSGYRPSIDGNIDACEILPHGKLEMDGMKVFNFGLKIVPQLITDTLKKNDLTLDQIDLFIFHQPSRFLLDVLRKKINIPESKFFINIEQHGNTSSTSIPLALSDAQAQGKLKHGMIVLLAGFGVGYSWAGTIIKT